MKLLNGKMEEQLCLLEDNSIDSIITDPPYGIDFMGKKWDYDVPTAAMWEECIRVLKPGGHLLSFSSARTYHRMTVAIEDAGFEIRDQVMWVYGSGFPKSHNIGKSYDKKYGIEREVVGTTNQPSASGHHAGNTGRGEESTERHILPLTSGSGPYEGWGTALKPAHEPICVARKPISEKTILANMEKYGVGGINIGVSRIPYSDDNPMPAMNGGITSLPMGWDAQTPNQDNVKPGSVDGRWPANLIHDGSEEVLDLFPDKTARFFYVPKVGKKERNEGTSNNTHPTVKPIALMEYLINMTTPAGGVVLDPFMGSGSTGCAAVKNGYDFIGVEMEESSYEVAKARIDYWSK